MTQSICPSIPLFQSSLRIQVGVFFAIFCSYLLFAPNYTWVEHSGDTPYGADFLQEWVGARMIVSGHGEQLYDVSTFRDWQHNSNLVGFEWQSDQYFPPVYPPTHYLLFTPFAALPYQWATIVWLCILVASALLSSLLLSQIISTQVTTSDHRNHETNAHRKTNYVWIGLLLFPSLLFSITLGQKSVCWLVILCITWRLLQTNREIFAGLVFGLLSIKPTLFFLFPLVMLRNRHWKFFVGASISVVGLWGSAICLLPWNVWIEFAQGLRSVGNYAENPGYRIDWSCNLMTFAYSLPAELSVWCKWAICLPLSIYLLFCVFEDKSYPVASPEKALMLFATTLLISPHSYHYDLCILLLPILWLVVTSPVQGVVYFALLSIGVAIAPQAQEYLRLPILPLLMFGIVSELRLRSLLHPARTNLCVSVSQNS